jgi:hypothetical protein
VIWWDVGPPIDLSHGKRCLLLESPIRSPCSVMNFESMSSKTERLHRFLGIKYRELCIIPESNGLAAQVDHKSKDVEISRCH